MLCGRKDHYGAHTIRGLKQTHQPSPWINDYVQFSIMPIRGRDKVDEESRQSWFSHQSVIMAVFTLSEVVKGPGVKSKYGLIIV